MNSESRYRIVVLGPALRSAGGLSVGRNMVSALVNYAPENEYYFIVPKGVGYEEICDKSPRYQTLYVEEMSALARILFDKFRLPKIISKFAPDYILGITALGLINPPCPQCALVDQPQLIYDDKHLGPRTVRDRMRHAYLRWHFKKQLDATKLILCRTNAVADRIRSRYDYRGHRLVCGASVSINFHDKPESQTEDRLKNFQGKLKLLYVTQYYPHKNIESIIELFRAYRDQLKDVVVFLTITEEEHPNVPGILESIKRERLESSIVNLGKIPHEEIHEFYFSSDALFMPSLLETLGVPYLEALRAELPILTSDIDFARATCGDAALYFDPWKLDSMMDVILRFRNQSQLRKDLRDACRKQVNDEHQTWEDVAQSVLLALIDQNENRNIE